MKPERDYKIKIKSFHMVLSEPNIIFQSTEFPEVPRN